ncbi:flagellar biosynthetic protein FliO [Gilliamella sp. wkB178]|uniref:flagellar biosynthetic protein FliO n=1 Tax=Gilliamella sp. wkB178 TaxID=3120259 RepID=UPI00080DE478|nr:flagellar biosynthetic protein FliO [Gilliamella apicola]OCG10320.1 flagellar biosynthetic protein FliO [Gilliamella apicola]
MSNNLLDATQTSELTTYSAITTSASAPDVNFYSHAGTSIGLPFIGIISIILVLGWLVKRFGGKNTTGNLIDIKASYVINPKERIILVQVDQQLLLIGVTPQQMTLLHTLSEERSQILLSQSTAVNDCLKKSLFQQILQSTLKSNKE